MTTYDKQFYSKEERLKMLLDKQEGFARRCYGNVLVLRKKTYEKDPELVKAVKRGIIAQRRWNLLRTYGINILY